MANDRWQDKWSRLILSLDNVSKTFHRAGKLADALTEVSLDLGSGDFIGILGPSGAGKTTLLRLAAGLVRPDSGSVLYQGQPLAEMSKAEAELYRRREVGSIWGSRYLHPGLSILDNVALPLLADGRGRDRAYARKPYPLPERWQASDGEIRAEDG